MGMSYNPFSLEGKIVLITGGSAGIGRATAIECSKMGASVIITGRNVQRLEETIQMLDQSDGQQHQYIVADFVKPEAVSTILDAIPTIDGLVNNAGINKILPIQFVNETELMNTLQTNMIAPILLTQALLKKKKINKGGSIVFVSSIAGHTRSSVGNTMYCASKGGVSGFMRCLSKEMASKKIRCNAILPGQTDTNIMSQGAVSTEQMDKVKQAIPLKRLGDPKDVAWGIIYLLSDAASYVTGISLIVDGGISV